MNAVTTFLCRFRTIFLTKVVVNLWSKIEIPDEPRVIPLPASTNFYGGSYRIKRNR